MSNQINQEGYKAGAEWLFSYYRGDIDYLDALEIATGIIKAAKENEMDTKTAEPSTKELEKALATVAEARIEWTDRDHVQALSYALSLALDIVEYYAVPWDESADFNEVRMGALA